MVAHRRGHSSFDLCFAEHLPLVIPGLDRRQIGAGEAQLPGSLCCSKQSTGPRAVQVKRQLASTNHRGLPAKAGPWYARSMPREKALLYKGMPSRLKRLRKERGLTPHGLAMNAGLSRTAVTDLESAKSAPHVDTIERLARALDVPAGWLAFGDSGLPLSLNHRTAPGFDPMTLSRDLLAIVNGCGGPIEQSFLYIDPFGAASWRQLVDAYKGLPLKEAVAFIAGISEQQPLDLIALGVGTGHTETQLAQYFLDAGFADLSLYLIDISQPLLSAAYQLASEKLGNCVPITAIEGDFYKLPNFMHFLSPNLPTRKIKRQRLVCMFGYTFGNLENEVRFVRNSLVGFQRGDYLLLDVVLAYAPADQPQSILSKDPAFSRKRPPEFQAKYDEFILGPIRRNIANISRIVLTPALDTTSCPIRGSYAVDLRAKVTLLDGQTKEFSAACGKRYEPTGLSDCLAQEGWRQVHLWPYGSDFPSMLILFVRD